MDETQDVHLDLHTASELSSLVTLMFFVYFHSKKGGNSLRSKISSDSYWTLRKPPMAADGPCVNDIGFAVNVHLMRLASVGKVERCGRWRRRPEGGDGASRSQQEEDCT